MLLEVIEPITPKYLKCKTYKQEPLLKNTNTQNNKIYNKIDLFIIYEYLSRHGPEEELYNITTTENTTIKQIKEELNKSFIYGDLEYNQYEIYKGGEQEDKERPPEPQKHFYIYLEPQLLDDDNKTIKECNITNCEVLRLKAKIKILLYIPCCRYTTIYLYTNNTLEDIQKEVIKIFNKRHNSNIKPKQITAFYGDKEIEEHEELSTYNIYNYSTITADIDYNIK